MTVHPYLPPAICTLGWIAGIGMSDMWLTFAGAIAAMFIHAKPWDPFLDSKVRERKSNEAPD